MLKNLSETTKEDLPHVVASMLHRGYRFVTITCLDAGECFEILYHFDKDYELVNFRLKLPKDSDLPSISGIFLAAVIVENEMKDLFGISVTNMALDFGGRFLLTEDAPKAPMLKVIASQAKATAAPAAASTESK